MFTVNQIVKGRGEGKFVILSFHKTPGSPVCLGEEGAFVKSVHPVTLIPDRGQIWLPLSVLREV